MRAYNLHKAGECAENVTAGGATTGRQRLAVAGSGKSEIRDCEMWEVRGRAVYNDTGQ